MIILCFGHSGVIRRHPNLGFLAFLGNPPESHSDQNQAGFRLILLINRILLITTGVLLLKKRNTLSGESSVAQGDLGIKIYLPHSFFCGGLFILQIN